MNSEALDVNRPVLPGASIPLIVGVAGHRNVCSEDVAALKVRVREVFRELRQRYPHTPLAILSPLNEGADRLVAEVALETEFGASLIAVLPWPKDIYPEGHCRSGDRAEFDRLLARAADVIYVPLYEAEKVRAEDLPHSDKSRRAQYQYVGMLIARHSQLLIALWDGYEVHDSATWRVIQWQRNGVPAPYAAPLDELDHAEPGPIYHIITPRAGKPRPAEAGSLKRLYPPASAEATDAERAIHTLWEYIDRFNRDAADVARNATKSVIRNKGYVAEEPLAETLPDPLKNLLDLFALADTASQEFQHQTRQTVKWLFVLAFASVMCLETYAHFFPVRPLLAVHLALLAAGFVWYVVAQRRKIQARYLDYRALAEALRVQLFWRWAGLTNSVADHYLRHFRGELDWIRAAVRTCFLISGGHDGKIPDTTPSANVIEAIRNVRQRWVEDQMQFFSKSGKRDERSERRFDIAAWTSFGAAVVLAVVQLFLPQISHVLILSLFAALVVAAILEDYAEFRAFAVQSRKYHWMADLYGKANNRLNALLGDANPAITMTEKDVATARALTRELGKEALAENADWVVQHRQRPPVWKHG